MLTLSFAVLALCSCGKDGANGFSAGSCIALAEVGAEQGSLSVSVETSGIWRLGCSEDWLSFDVEGGNGNQAFTIFFDSNEPDILNLKQARTARIAISLDSDMVSDTLILVQRGFLGGSPGYKVSSDKRISLEFDSKAITEACFVCSSSDGLDDSAALRDWIASKGADAFVLDGVAEGSLPGGLSIAGCNFKGMGPEEEYAAFKAAVNASINSSYEGSTRWIVAGQMYHYSSMQTGYPATPAWYPSDARGDDFLPDRFAWQNNLYDCAWMASHDFVITFTDDQGHAYSADYVYVSSAVLGMISSFELVDAPVAGMTHKAFVIRFKI